MEIILSKENAIIKQYRKLATSAGERREQCLVVLEGLRLCQEAAIAGAEITHLLVTKQALDRLDGLEQLQQAAQQSWVIAPILAQVLSQTKTSQEVYCICRMPKHQLPSLGKGGKFLLIERLQDPGNMGTIIRCAEAFGMAAVVVTRDCADFWSPKVLRSTMGSCFRQLVVEVDSLTETIVQLQAAQISVYAATLNRSSIPPLELERGNNGIAVVVGNEGSGVSQAVVDACGQSVYIPMTPKIESLNVATAAAVLMWELFGRGNGGF